MNIGHRATPQTPPLFGNAIARQCTRWTRNGNCGKEPVLHVAWSLDDEGCDGGFVCAEHAPELGVRWTYLQAHEPGVDCGMPGAAWFFDENRCAYEGDLPTAPAVAREVVAV